MSGRKDGVQAAYRNDQRQEYVNNVAYKHGTGLGTAPWYGVPGTAYDFGNSKPAGPTYHTDASHPNGYGYESSVPQYHSQPATYGHSAGAGHASGYKAGKEIASEKCSSLAEGYDIKHGKSAATYQPSADKPAMPLPAAYSKVIGRSLDGGYVVSPADRTYSGSAGYSKVGYDDLTLPAGYVSGSYEALGYRGYMY